MPTPATLPRPHPAPARPAAAPVRPARQRTRLVRAPEPAPEPAPVPEPAPEPAPAPELVVEPASVPAPEPVVELAPAPVPVGGESFPPSLTHWRGPTATAGQIVLLVWIAVLAVLLVDSQSLSRRVDSSTDQVERLLVGPVARAAEQVAVPSGLVRPRLWLDTLLGTGQATSGAAFEDGDLPLADALIPDAGGLGEPAPVGDGGAAAPPPAPVGAGAGPAAEQAPGELAGGRGTPSASTAREWTYRGRDERLPRRPQPPPVLDEVPTRRPTPGRPLRLLVTGDSTSTYPGFALQSRLADDPRVRVATVWRNGTGLATPQRFDWSSFAPAEAARRQADVVVISLGANDAWPLRRRGEVYPLTTARWRAEYARRVAVLAQQLRVAGVDHVIWLTPPQVSDPVHQEVFGDITLAVRAASEYLPGLVMVDLHSGRPVVRRERQADGIHFTRDASDAIAGLVLETLTDTYPMIGP